MFSDLLAFWKVFSFNVSGTQYLVGSPFALITASIRRGMEVNSLWHCWGGMEAQVALTVAFSSSAFFDLVSHCPLDNTPEILYGFQVWWVCWPVKHTNKLVTLWSSPKFLNRFCLTILIRLRFSRLVVHLFLLHVFLPLNFLLTCLDTALCEQPTSLAINVCGLPSLWRVSMIVFWTTLRSAVILMIV